MGARSDSDARCLPALESACWMAGVFAAGGVLWRELILHFIYEGAWSPACWLAWWVMDFGPLWALFAAAGLVPALFPGRVRGPAEGLIRWGAACGFTLMWLGAGVFHHQFGVPFDARVLGVFYDDKRALFRTAESQYGWDWILLVWLGITLISGLLPEWGLRRVAWIGTRVRMGLVIGSAMLAAYGIYAASAGWGRITGVVDAAVASPVVKVRRSPWVQLSEVFWHDAESEGITSEALRHRLRHGWAQATPGLRVDTLLRRVASGGRAAPRQVFLVVMESYDMTLVDGPGPAAACTSELRNLMGRGVVADQFTSEGSATIYSVGPLLSGVPQVGTAPQPYAARLTKPLATSLAGTFKRFGFRARFYYGGTEKWQNIGAFARAQGFDVVSCAEHIPHPQGAMHEWGMDDRYLFRHVQAEATLAKEPTLHVVLTTSNHAPFFLPAGVESAKSELDIVQRKRFRGVGVATQVRHLAYSDACLGEFVRETERAVPESLFAITGDHPSPLAKQAAHEGWRNRRVPFVVYGPSYVKAGERLAPGTHLDIVPTLATWCALRPTDYVSFGENLRGHRVAPRRVRDGNGLVACDTGLVPLDAVLEIAPEFSPMPAWAAQVAAYRGVAWWYLNRSEWLP